MIKIIPVFFILLLSACSDSESCDRSFNEPFDIQTGEIYCLDDGSTLEIIEITSSYCPCNAVCIWQGETTVSGQRITGDQVEVVLFHEELIDENPEWGQISSIEVTEDCTPRPTKVSIIITN